MYTKVAYWGGLGPPTPGDELKASSRARPESATPRLRRRRVRRRCGAVARWNGTASGPGCARREAEEFLSQFEILFPDPELVRIALRGAAAYQLSWFDAHLWADAERFGLGQLLSEDFQHGRLYGTVEIVDPFRASDPRLEH
jgi:hypothetical protein